MSIAHTYWKIKSNSSLVYLQIARLNKDAFAKEQYTMVFYNRCSKNKEEDKAGILGHVRF